MSCVRPNPRVRLGQHYLPDWDAFHADFDALCERRYFANNGPLVVRLDARFGPCVGARESVAVTNELLAAAILTRALGLAGPVAVPALASLSLVQGLAWGGATPVLCDVAQDEEGLDAARLAEDPREFRALGVVLAPHAPAIPPALEREAARRGVPLLVDASRALGCEVAGRPVAAGPHASYFSFNTRHVVNGGEGASVTTSDPALAERLRYVRSFHAASATARVMPRINGKLAEAPAALIHRGLDELPERIAQNRALFGRYIELLGHREHARVLTPGPDVRSNHEALELELGGADPAAWAERAVRALAEVGIEAARPYSPRELCRALARPRAPQRPEADAVYEGPWPVAEARAARRLELPLGAGVSASDVEEICEIVSRASEA